MALDQTLDSPTKIPQPTVRFCAPTSRFFGTRKRSNKRRRRNMEEEEYLAMCLVKLATGSDKIIKRPTSLSLKYPTSFIQEEEKIVLTKTTDVEKVEQEEEKSVLTTTTTTTIDVVKKDDDEEPKIGHACNECNKSFSTHQGLGGHKASHRINNSRKVIERKRKQKLSTGGKIHDCNVCRKTFPSGQALGGHMRKHFDATLISVSAKTNDNPSSEENVTNEGGGATISTGSRVVFDYDLNVTLTPEDDDLYCDEVLSEQFTLFV